VAAVGGNVSDEAALRNALGAARSASTRGDFRYNTNHFPIQDLYLVQAIRRADGKYATAVRERIFDDHADRQAER
jgi:branched-chain amino acid transport system substrate-binding protein